MSAFEYLELAGKAASLLYGLRGNLSALPGYDDHNFRVDTPSATYILKISEPDTDPGIADFQTALLGFLEGSSLPFGTPRVVSTRRGEPWDYVEDDRGEKRIVRLLTWIPGSFLAAVSKPSNPLLFSIGSGLAKMNQLLAGFSFPGMDREFDWDIRQALLLVPELDAITDARRRALAESAFTRFEDVVQPILQSLPATVIHNDANEHNIMVSIGEGEWSMRGLIDFGDAMRTATVIEPAVAATYAMMLREDGAAAAGALLSGYHCDRPLHDSEIILLADLIRTRLCVSVVQSARKSVRGGRDAYVTVSEDGAWRLLESMKEDGWMRLADTLQHVLDHP